MTVDENYLMMTIVKGSDWHDIITQIIVEENMDPWDIDIKKLADTFVVYLQKMKDFDFRVPARFILIAAILLRMKCELMMEEEEKEKEIKESEIPALDISKVPQLEPPILRMPTRKVSLSELVSALNKAIDFKDRKENREIRMKKAVETLIEPPDDIEARIIKILNDIKVRETITFSELVPEKTRRKMVSVFLPLLHLFNRESIDMKQEELFKEIFITFKGEEKIL